MSPVPNPNTDLRPDGPPRWPTDAAQQAPLLAFVLAGLRASGCAVLAHSPEAFAPLVVSYERPSGARVGIVVYATALGASGEPGSGPAGATPAWPPLWHDPMALHTTLLLGIDVSAGVFVGLDPVVHEEAPGDACWAWDRELAAQARAHGWMTFEYDPGEDGEGPIEARVAGAPEAFDRYVAFERDALGEDAGHRQLLAERSGAWSRP